jgi:hypothetical protein
MPLLLCIAVVVAYLSINSHRFPADPAPTSGKKLRIDNNKHDLTGESSISTKVKHDQVRSFQAALPERSENIQKTVEIINGDKMKNALMPVLHRYGKGEDEYEKLTKIYRDMDIKLLNLARDRDINLPKEIGDRSNVDLVEGFNKKHKIKGEQITEDARQEVLALLGDIKIVREIARVRSETLLEIAGLSTNPD